MGVRMDRKTIHAMVLLWMVGFLVVVVPAHRRGIIRLPGHSSSVIAVLEDGQKSSAPYCPLCSLLPAAGHDGNLNPPPPADAPINCAICYLKLGLDLPTEMIEPPTQVRALEYLLFFAVATEPVAPDRQYTLHGPAPPLA